MLFFCWSWDIHHPSPPILRHQHPWLLLRPLDSDWITPLVLLGLQLANGRWQDFSASMTAGATCYKKSPLTHISIFAMHSFSVEKVDCIPLIVFTGPTASPPQMLFSPDVPSGTPDVTWVPFLPLLWDAECPWEQFTRGIAVVWNLLLFLTRMEGHWPKYLGWVCIFASPVSVMVNGTY